MITTSPTTHDGANAARTKPFHASALAVSLTVKDVATSRDWYRDVLGFTVDREHEREGTLRAVSLKAGAVSLLLSQDDGAKGWARIKGEGISLQLTTPQNIDELAHRIKTLGGTLDSEPVDAWGVRVFRLRDPDGFKLVISSERTG